MAVNYIEYDFQKIRPLIYGAIENVIGCEILPIYRILLCSHAKFIVDISLMVSHTMEDDKTIISVLNVSGAIRAVETRAMNVVRKQARKKDRVKIMAIIMEAQEKEARAFERSIRIQLQRDD